MQSIFTIFNLTHVIIIFKIMRKAEFEEGNKTLPGVLTRRMIRNPVMAEVLPGIIDSLFGGARSAKINHLRLVAQNTLATLPHSAEELIFKNLLFFPDQVFLRASPYHMDNWLRDSFYTCLCIDEPSLELHLLGNFLESYRDLQLPTARLIFSDRQWFFDDESTMLGIIWRAKILQAGGSISADARCEWQEYLDWVTSHSKEGFYETGAGTGISWFDTFDFPQADTTSYNQGIYVASLIAAEKLGLHSIKRERARATAAYNSLVHPSGRFQFSRHFSYKDASSLVGEFLVGELFNESILDKPEVAICTVETLNKSRAGFKVVTDENGEFLDPRQFRKPCPKGDYHNGADWPLFSAIAMITAERAGLPEDKMFWIKMLGNLAQTKSAEYIRTYPEVLTYPDYNHSRINHAWNALVDVLAIRSSVS